MKYELNDEQGQALQAMEQFLRDDTPGRDFFILSGSAGVGKTYLVRALAEKMKGRLVFTAPTNKATRVLRQSLTTPDYFPDCRTIFSLLGLRLEPSGEIKELAEPEEDVDLSKFRCVIVDEGSMVSEKLRGHIHQAVERCGVKFIFLGDPAQLPPVGEDRSPIWRIKDGITLTKVMRHDNQILVLAQHLRSVVDQLAPKIRLEASNDGEQGVWAGTAFQLNQAVIAAADNGDFSRPDAAKVLAWRNVTVDRWNRLIRNRIFPEATETWLTGDRVIFTSPARNLDDEPMAATDDEGEVMRVGTGWHPAYGDFKIWNVDITLDQNKLVTARVLHPDSLVQWTERKTRMADEARANGRKWRDFWHFVDSFHQLRYAYALTVHRSQGSTYQDAYVDYRDILVNRNKSEAYRCLYVAATRPKVRLFLG